MNPGPQARNRSFLGFAIAMMLGFGAGLAAFLLWNFLEHGVQ